MPTWLTQLRFPTTPAEFISRYSLPETILQMRDASESPNPFALRQRMTCEFDGTVVRLARLVPFVSSQHSPVFTGSLREDSRGVLLSGQSAVKRWVIVHQNIGFIFAAFFGGIFMLTALTQLRTMWPVPFVAAGALALMYGQTRLLHRLARNDVEWLSRRIGQTIGDPAEWPEPPLKPPGWLRRKFLTLSGQ